MESKRHNESFFGLHSDFYAKPSAGCVIGATLREADIRALCETMRPDFIQIDCKGHPGWASYPTKRGNAMPRFAQDPLVLWRRITAEYGIGLYRHISRRFLTAKAPPILLCSEEIAFLPGLWYTVKQEHAT